MASSIAEERDYQIADDGCAWLHKDVALVK